MSSNRVVPAGPPIPPRSVVEALVPLIRDQLPGLAIGAMVTADVLQQVVGIIKRNIAALLGGGLMAAGLAALLPSLAVVVVNALGWTASGVVLGSVAAGFQAAVYGASTTGLFSALQAFGATALIASPAVLAVGGISLAVGAGFFSYWLYKKSRRGGVGTGPSSGHGGNDNTPSASTSNTVSRRYSTFNFFDLFRSNGKSKFD